MFKPDFAAIINISVILLFITKIYLYNSVTNLKFHRVTSEISFRFVQKK